MTQHTPEPWVLHRGGKSVGANDGTGVCEVWSRGDDYYPTQEGESNARRIVACVNAMTGIADDNAVFTQGNSVRKVISSMAIKQADAEKRAADLQAQVDEILDLLQSLENDAGQIPQFMWTKIQHVVKKHTGEPK